MGARFWIAVAVVLAGCEQPTVRAPDSERRDGPRAEPDGQAAPPSPDAATFTVPEVAPPAPVPDTAPADCGRLLATVRDFRSAHSDFEKENLNTARLFPGIVRPDLGADGKPVHAQPGPTAATSGPAIFDQWYRDVPGINLSFEVPLPLVELRPGIFVYDNQAFFPDRPPGMARRRALRAQLSLHDRDPHAVSLPGRRALHLHGRR